MPRVPFESLPYDARVWIFGSSDSITSDGAKMLLAAVDEWLDSWKAHGDPLVCARDWKEGRFLVIGVDQRSVGASGCSVDALFRVLKSLESSIGTTLLGNDRVFYRTGAETILAGERSQFSALAQSGLVHESTRVFDTSITDAGTYRTSFEKLAADSWHRALLKPSSAPGSQRQTNRL